MRSHSDEKDYTLCYSQDSRVLRLGYFTKRGSIKVNAFVQLRKLKKRR